MATKMKLSLIAVYPPAKPNALCVWNMTDPPHTINRWSVKDEDEAKALIRRLVKEQKDDESIGCNSFGLEVYQDDEWMEWDDGEGCDIMEVIEFEDEKGTVT